MYAAIINFCNAHATPPRVRMKVNDNRPLIYSRQLYKMKNSRRLYMGLCLVLLVVSLLAYVGIGRALVAKSAAVDSYKPNMTAIAEGLEDGIQDPVMVGPYLSYHLNYDYFFTPKSIVRETKKVIFEYGGVIFGESHEEDKLYFDIKMPCDVDFEKWHNAMDASMRYDFAFRMKELQRQIRITKQYVADLNNCTVDQEDNHIRATGHR
ncbi:hypothetical protein V1521DRAFT_485113 [Lipomyces starkeyi]